MKFYFLKYWNIVIIILSFVDSFYLNLWWLYLKVLFMDIKDLKCISRNIFCSILNYYMKDWFVVFNWMIIDKSFINKCNS